MEDKGRLLNNISSDCLNETARRLALKILTSNSNSDKCDEFKSLLNAATDEEKHYILTNNDYEIFRIAATGDSKNAALILIGYANPAQKIAMIKSADYQVLRYCVSERKVELFSSMFKVAARYNAYCEIDVMFDLLSAYNYRMFERNILSQKGFAEIFLSTISKEQKDFLLTLNDFEIFRMAANNFHLRAAKVLLKHASAEQKEEMLISRSCEVFKKAILQDSNLVLEMLLQDSSNYVINSVFQMLSYHYQDFNSNILKQGNCLNLLLNYADDFSKKEVLFRLSVAACANQSSSCFYYTYDYYKSQDIQANLLRFIMSLQKDLTSAEQVDMLTSNACEAWRYTIYKMNSSLLTLLLEIVREEEEVIDFLFDVLSSNGYVAFGETVLANDKIVQTLLDYADNTQKEDIFIYDNYKSFMDALYSDNSIVLELLLKDADQEEIVNVVFSILKENNYIVFGKTILRNTNCLHALLSYANDKQKLEILSHNDYELFMNTISSMSKSNNYWGVEALLKYNRRFPEIINYIFSTLRGNKYMINDNSIFDKANLLELLFNNVPAGQKSNIISHNDYELFDTILRTKAYEKASCLNIVFTNAPRNQKIHLIKMLDYECFRAAVTAECNTELLDNLLNFTSKEETEYVLSMNDYELFRIATYSKIVKKLLDHANEEQIANMISYSVTSKYIKAELDYCNKIAKKLAFPDDEKVQEICIPDSLIVKHRILVLPKKYNFNSINQDVFDNESLNNGVLFYIYSALRAPPVQWIGKILPQYTNLKIIAKKLTLKSKADYYTMNGYEQERMDDSDRVSNYNKKAIELITSMAYNKTSEDYLGILDKVYYTSTDLLASVHNCPVEIEQVIFEMNGLLGLEVIGSMEGKMELS